MSGLGHVFGPRYNFGVYHWRRRLRSIAVAVLVLVIAVTVERRAQRWHRRLVATVVSLAAAVYGGRTMHQLVSPPPWRLERYKYDALAAHLPLERAERVLDVGCGTGRSLVGLAPHVPSGPNGPDVLGVDVFDDRVILGNGPQLARQNAGRAGLSVEPIAGDAATLPVRDRAVDVVTACRVLHDLPEPAANEALRELQRICTATGTVGILELPLLPDGVETDCNSGSGAKPDPESYWTNRVTDAGFTIETVERLERPGKREPYISIVASPDASSLD
ncbi:class I SAM-dependent methyltransferase [Natronorubrum sp. A-ect3]|uniref:class I SAM-dependent methyltransferase n=1 Tax=Natronorubrum sp. A-ect3 TaxID=3242698 RepID=UPI00359DD504